MRGRIPDGIRTVAATADSAADNLRGHIPFNAKADQYEADMGVPKLNPEEIPFIPEQPMDRVINHPFKVDGEELRISLCATGNPHCSLFVPEIDDQVVERLGPRLENDPAFPESHECGIHQGT